MRSGAIPGYIMNYVYILQSELDGSKYTGVTQDLKRRVAEHNNGDAKYSKSKNHIN
jgi:Predicted endonuclease containing a URI domain